MDGKGGHCEAFEYGKGGHSAVFLNKTGAVLCNLRSFV
jgi:hypothetical protein